MTINDILELIATNPDGYFWLLEQETENNEENYYTTAGAYHNDTCEFCGNKIDLEYYLVDGQTMCTDCFEKKYNNAFEWELKVMDNIINNI